jgi:Lamin Tail Domain
VERQVFTQSIVDQATSMMPFGKQISRLFLVIATAVATLFSSVPLVHAEGAPRFNSTARLIVSEIMINPKGVPVSNGTWFELYNPTDQPFNLAGYYIYLYTISGEPPRYDSIPPKQIPEGVVVPAKGYFVVGNDNNTASNGNVIVDFALDIPNLSFAPTGGGVEIKSGFSDALACIIAWGTRINVVEASAGPEIIGKNFTDAPFVAGASLSLKNVSKKVLVGSTITIDDWCVSSTSYESAGNKGTPKSINKCLSESTTTKKCGLFLFAYIVRYRRSHLGIVQEVK